MRALIADVRQHPRAAEPVRFGLSCFVIARETEAEAQAAHERLLQLAALDADLKAHITANTDPAIVMRATMAKSPRVGTNGGTVGSYEQVAERLAAFHEAGIEMLLLQFQPFEAEMRRFARHVMPRLASLRETELQILSTAGMA